MKKQTRSIIIAIICSVCVTALICVVSFKIYLSTTDVKSGNSIASKYADKLDEIQSYINKYSIYDFNEDTAADYVYMGYVYGLKDDGYCAYYNKKDYENTMSSRQGNFTGIGITVKNSGNMSQGLFVYRVLGNSPAEAAGMKNCDRIINVDGKNMSEVTYDEAVNMLLAEEGTSVKITVCRDHVGGVSETLTFDITRKNFVQREVDYGVYDTNIGYVQIYSFSSIAETEFKEAIEKLTAMNVKGIIFDVRNNSGGNLTTVSNMLDMLMPKNEPIIIIESKKSEEIEYSTAARICDLPYVVLMNSSSASASELFASTLRDVCGAKLVGTKSFGKGIGQTTFPLSDGSGLKLTTFRYLTKSRVDYNGVGLIPDETVDLSSDKETMFYSLTREQDDQFLKAVETLKENIKKGE